MRTSSRAELGANLRRDQTRCVAAWRRCGPRWAVVALLGLGTAGRAQNVAKDDLPDAPSALMSQSTGVESQSKVSPSDATAKDAEGTTATALRPCKDADYPADKMPLQGPPPCIPENPIAPFVTSVHIKPLSSSEKGVLALKDFLDPFNFLTIAGYSGIAVASNPHSAYGSGFKGFATLTGYGLAEDAQGEIFQTYAIPSLLHQDPRYHRMPTASVKRRLLHAVEHTFVSQHDDGRPMPNYATLLTYPISAELSNAYVPGLQRNAAATCQRIAVGLATDPSGYIVAEFLPDVATHIHINITFLQNIVNTVAVGSPNTQ